MRPVGTMTFLFTDIEGSTRLWQESADAMAAAPNSQKPGACTTRSARADTCNESPSSSGRGIEAMRFCLRPTPPLTSVTIVVENRGRRRTTITRSCNISPKT